MLLKLKPCGYMHSGLVFGLWGCSNVNYDRIIDDNFIFKLPVWFYGRFAPDS